MSSFCDNKMRRRTKRRKRENGRCYDVSSITEDNFRRNIFEVAEVELSHSFLFRKLHCSIYYLCKSPFLCHTDVTRRPFASAQISPSLTLSLSLSLSLPISLFSLIHRIYARNRKSLRIWMNLLRPKNQHNRLFTRRKCRIRFFYNFI